MAPHCTPQPGICTSSWCAPHSGEGVSCGQGWLPPKLVRQLRREALVPVQSSQLQEQRLQVQLLWTPEGAAWIWGHGNIFWVGVGQRTVIQLPSGAHTNPLPLILPQPTVLSAAHPSPIAVPPPVIHLLIVINPVPGKEKKSLSQRPDLATKIVKEQSERLSNTMPRNIPDLTTPVPPPLPMPAPLPLPPMTSPNPPHTPLLLLPSPLPLLMTHLQIKTTPNEQRGSG